MPIRYGAIAIVKEPGNLRMARHGGAANTSVALRTLLADKLRCEGLDAGERTTEQVTAVKWDIVARFGWVAIAGLDLEQSILDFIDNDPGLAEYRLRHSPRGVVRRCHRVATDRATQLGRLVTLDTVPNVIDRYFLHERGDSAIVTEVKTWFRRWVDGRDSPHDAEVWDWTVSNGRVRKKLLLDILRERTAAGVKLHRLVLLADWCAAHHIVVASRRSPLAGAV